MMEFVLTPLMLPVALGYAVLCHFHRQASRYVPNIVSMDEENTVTYKVVAQDGILPPRYHVFDGANKLCFSFEVSRVSRGLFTFFQYDLKSGDRTPIGSVSAGIWSKFHVFKSEAPNTQNELTQFAVGTNHVNHQSDAIDNYRMFELSDNNVYQWAKRSKTLERVYNLGQKDSEVRERLAVVGILAGNRGYRVTLDTSKVSVAVVLMSSMISFLDQWNTMLGVGGIYFAVKHGELPWRRV